jgi:hypothetical protein
MEMMDWFPETVVRKSEDETPNRKGSKYGVIPLPPTVVESTPERIKVAMDIPPDVEDGKPYFTPGGTLVVPMDAPHRYRWWAGGISLAAIIAETAGLACPVDYTRISDFTDQ